MELGATYCTAKNPNCRACPIAQFCRSLAKGLTSDIPVTVTRPVIRKVVMAQWFLVANSGIVVLSPGIPALDCSGISGKVIRDDFSTLHHGLWTIPQTPWFDDSLDITSRLSHHHFTHEFIVNDCRFFASRSLKPMAGGNFYHGITHHRIRVENLILDLRGIDEGLILDFLKRSQTTLWGPRNPENSGFTMRVSFLSLDGGNSSSHPISKMIDKGIVRVKKTIG